MPQNYYINKIDFYLPKIIEKNINVLKFAKRKKRSPCEVARDIEENMLKRAKLVLTSNVSKSSTQSENYFDEAATQTQASQSSTAKPVLNQLHFVTTPTISSSSTMQSLLWVGGILLQEKNTSTCLPLGRCPLRAAMQILPRNSSDLRSFRPRTNFSLTRLQQKAWTWLCQIFSRDF